MKENHEIELEQKYAVISIPSNTVELAINAKIYLNGELKTVNTTYDMAEVQKAIKEAEDGYIPSDAKFVLTDKGKKIAQLIEKGMSFEDACALVDNGE